MKENLKLAFKFTFKSHHSIFFFENKEKLNSWEIKCYLCLLRMFNAFFLISINNLQTAFFNFFFFKETNLMKYNTKKIPWVYPMVINLMGLETFNL